MKKGKKYDKAGKDLIEAFEEQIIEYVIKSKPEKIETLDRELNLPDRRIDSVFKINNEYVLNIEFQTEYEDNIEFRMLLYNVLLKVKYNLPVRTIIIYLTKKNENKIKDFYLNKCFDTSIDFKFEVIKVWELNSDEILNKNIYGMYPLLALSRKDESLTKMIYDKIIKADITDDKRESLIKVLSTLLNLIYKGENIKNMLPVEKLEGLFDKIKTEAKSEGKAEGMAEGLKEGRLDGKIIEAKNLLIRLLNKKFKQIPKNLNKKINECQNAEILENIIENIFDIQTIEQVLPLLIK